MEGRNEKDAVNYGAAAVFIYREGGQKKDGSEEGSGAIQRMVCG